MAATVRSFIGFRDGKEGKSTFRGFNPATGEALEPEFHAATPEEVDLAARLAAEAFARFRELPGAKRAEFLNKIATNIEAAVEAIVERAHLETALPKPRLQSETARTVNQLRLFAKVAAEGSWVQARIDRADPNRKPLPKPGIRSLLRPLGPVVVFSASRHRLMNRPTSRR